MPKKPAGPSEEEAFHPVPKDEKTTGKPPESELETPSGRFVAFAQLTPTKFEKKIWTWMGKGSNPWVFRCQVSKFGYVLDFYSEKFLLAIEADGPDHLTQVEADMHRDKALLEHGIRTLRLRPVDFIKHSKSQLTAMIEEFAHPKHLVGGKK